MATIELFIYPSISKSGEAAKQFIDSYPDSIKKMFRIEDYTSGAGFLGTELFSMMVPLVMIGFAITWGAAAAAEDEEIGTADLLYSMPLRRSTILLSRIAATLSALIGLAVLTFLNIFLLEGQFDLSVDTSNLAWACVAQLALGLFFSGYGFLIGSASGKKGLTVGTGSGIGIITFLFFSLAPLVDTLDFTKAVNPFEWTIAKNALMYGPDFAGMFKLFVVALIAHALALIIIERREIHS